MAPGSKTLPPTSILTISLVALSLTALISNFLIANHVSQLSHTSPVLASSLRKFRQRERAPRLLLPSAKTFRRKKLQLDDDEEITRQQLNGMSMSNKLPLPDEHPVDNPSPPPSGNDTFAACLLVMDDNHRAVEWMAYHYHVLPLRYLIVAVDPRSRTKPTAILNRYRKMGVYIEEWTDHDFLDPRLAKKKLDNDARFQVKRDRHRARQKVFYRSCLVKMKAANRTYVTMHDTDEYLVYNQPPPTPWKKTHTPNTAEQGAMIRYIQQQQASGNDYFGPCISVPRLHFGAVESTLQERAKDMPRGFDAEQLDTFRWRKHCKRDDFVHNNLAKVIIDVSRVNLSDTPRFRSLHRPIPSICQAPWVKDKEAGLRINHYLGSWESFSFRDDSRRGGERSREAWEFQAGDQQETDDNIRPWLDGLVQTEGYDKAKELLHGAGLPKSYRNQNDTAWRSMWVQDILQKNETEGTNPRNHEFDAFVRRKFQSA
ncbi:expressed unknown protein [Seminavis robusta]|uniref:Uncharacterized protein n=1 Tax=Seminavis robusta TaxID=568900 RepID=A0A9N8EZJ7_9STRA|nr:expressed unknown protein [Seminavis robusta]|eukprot:Sro2610_g332520.1 n/a (485) ;mRNA; r:8435-9889